MREIKIAKNDAGQRLDKFLTKALDLPVGLLYKSIRTKKIKVNRKLTEELLCEEALDGVPLHKHGVVLSALAIDLYLLCSYRFV